MNVLKRNIIPQVGALLGLLCLAAPGPAWTTATPGEANQQIETPDEISDSDWRSILAAHDQNRHAVQSDDQKPAVWQARNPDQQWLSAYNGHDVKISPDHGRWQFGLELEGWGYAGQENRTAAIDDIEAEGERIVYRYGDGLEQWFINDQRGLEHGFTVNRPPAGNGDALRFEMAVAGDLVPRVAADGRDIAFVDSRGATALTYNGLKVWDAEGTPLPAGFTSHGDQLSLTVDDSGARYPITIDPLFQQEAYLKASNTDANDSFGHSVAVSGDTVVVGARREASSSTGVDGNEADDSASSSGAVYVFVRDGSGNWTQQAYLKASNTDAADEFGYSVAISGDTVVVGAPLEDSDATGVDGNQGDNSVGNAGAAYVFARDGSGDWTQQAYLKASNTDANDEFGYSVAVSGDTVVVGARQESSNATGVDGNQGDNSAASAGASYVFVRDGSGDWTQQAYLKASNTDANDLFGNAVAISGDTVVVGASVEDSSATGVDGNQADNSASSSGAAYVFFRDGSGAWSQQAYLKASNTDAIDQFGGSVGVSGNIVVVGAHREASNATGVDGNQADNSAGGAGAAYVFARGGSGSWSQQAYLKASNTDAADEFGRSAAVSQGIVVIGARQENSSATGVDGNQADNSASNSGAAYVFVPDGSGSWLQQEYIKASNTDAVDQFGGAVAVSGDTVVSGARLEDSIATGVDGNQADNSVSGSGAAYVYTVPQFSVGGTVSGLSGSGLVLQNNAGDDEAVVANGTFTFPPQNDGTVYDVTVLDQPSGPSQTCTVINGSGTLAGANVTNVDVTCVTDQFTVGGTVSGLSGSGLVLQNNAGDDQTIVANGTFTFSPQDDGTAYDITVLDQPAGPSQTCTVTNGSGTLAGANVTNVDVTCVTDQFTVGGTVSGLSGSGLVLQNNSGDDQAIASNGTFTFSPQDDGTSYDITVLTQPSGPIQTCTVGNDSGTLAGADVTDVNVDCVDEPPEVTLSATAIGFGVVNLGTVSTQTLTVTNTGTGELVISNISEPPAPFSVVGGSCAPVPVTVLPAETCTIEVSFEPDSFGGIFTDSLNIVSNADSSVDTVELSGEVPVVEIPVFSRAGILLLTLFLAVIGWLALGRTQSA